MIIEAEHANTLSCAQTEISSLPPGKKSTFALEDSPRSFNLRMIIRNNLDLKMKPLTIAYVMFQTNSPSAKSLALSQVCSKIVDTDDRLDR